MKHRAVRGPKYRAMRWLGCALICLLCACPLWACADAVTVENDRLLLTLDTQTLEISVTEKGTGGVISSVNDAADSAANASWKGFLSSTLAIEVTNGTSLLAERVDIATAQPKKSVAAVDGGFDIALDFEKQKQRLTLCVRLEKDAVHVFVPGASIEEYGESALCGLYITPFFGATRLAEKAGYMFIPEGSGAIVALSDGQNRTNTPYAKMIYGGNIGVEKPMTAVEGAPMVRQALDITLPVFGMAYTGEGLGFLGVVSEGAEAAELLCYPAGVITEYNWVTARFILREEYIMQTTRTQGLQAREKNAYVRDMGLRFYVLTGEDASYAGMAQRYREKLTAEGMLTTSPEADDYRVRLDFLGAESKKWFLWDQLVPMTTVQQMAGILEEYEGAGLQAPLVIYRGWQRGGEFRSFGSTDAKLDGKLGTQAALTETANRITVGGGQFYLALEGVMANADRVYNTNTDLVRSISQTVARNWGIQFQTPRRTGELLGQFRARWGADCPFVAISSLGNMLYSRYTGAGNLTRGDTLAEYRAVLGAQDGVKTALYNPLDVYLDYTDVYLNLPLSSSGYSFLKAEVPFLPMVLSGNLAYYGTYVNFAPNRQLMRLKLVEYGANPSFLITYEDVSKLVDTAAYDIYLARYDILQGDVLAMDAYLAPFREATRGAAMTGHTLLGQVAIVTYGNGARIAVNYGAKDAEVAGAVVPGMGALILEGGRLP